MIRLRDDPTRAISHDELVAQAAQYLGLRGWLTVITHDAWHHPVEPGVFDLLALAPGSLALDVKLGRDKLSPDQIEFADRAIRRHIRVHEIRTFDDLTVIVHQCEED